VVHEAPRQVGTPPLRAGGTERCAGETEPGGEAGGMIRPRGGVAWLLTVRICIFFFSLRGSNQSFHLFGRPFLSFPFLASHWAWGGLVRVEGPAARTEAVGRTRGVCFW